MNEAKPIVKAKRKTFFISGYSTKYALTQGIYKVEIDLEYGGDPEPKKGDAVYSSDHKYPGSVRQQLHYGKTFFENVHDAEENARSQAKKKLTSLDRQRAEMVKLALKPKMATDD
jgi:hypothetical protein